MGMLRAPDGSIVDVPDAQSDMFRASGYEPVDAGSSTAMSDAMARPDSGALSGIGALASSTLSGATLGLSDVALKGLLNRGDFERLATDRELHPVLSGVGQMTGTLLPMFAAPGSALSNLPAGVVSRTAMGGVEAAREIGGARGALAALGVSGVEGSLYNAGAYLSDTALGDRELSAEGLAGALGSGFEFGAAGGVAAMGIEHGSIAARRMFSRLADGGKRAYAEAEQAWLAKYQSTLEANDAAAEIARAKLAEAQLARQQADVVRQNAAAQVATAKAAAPGMDAAAAAEQQAASLAGMSDAERAAGLIADRGHVALAGGDTGVMSDIERQLKELAGRDPRTAAALGLGGDPLAAPLSPAAADDLAAAVAEHDAARAELDDILRRIESPDVGQPGGAIGQNVVPIGEFGAPGARGFKTQDELGRLAEGSAPRAAGTPAEAAPQAPATSVGKRRPAELTTPFDFEPQITKVGRAQPEAQGGMPAAASPLTDREFSAYADEWRESLDGDAKGALETYSRNGTYGLINSPLRETGDLSRVPDHLRDTVSSMDRAVASSPAPRDLVAYRGIHWDKAVKQWEGVAPGDVLVDPGFGSTSASESVGRGYAKGMNVRPGVVLRIDVPKGFPAAPVPSEIFGSERELLLPRNTKYTVTKVEESNGQRVIHVTASAAKEGEASVVAASAGRPTDVNLMNVRQLEEHMNALDKIRNDLDRPGLRDGEEFRRVQQESEAAYQRHRAIRNGTIPEPSGVPQPKQAADEFAPEVTRTSSPPRPADAAGPPRVGMRKIAGDESVPDIPGHATHPSITEDEIDAWQSDFKAGLTKDEIGWSHFYAGGSAGKFREINGALRGKVVPQDDKIILDTIDSILDNGRAEKSFRTYRGVGVGLQVEDEAKRALLNKEHRDFWSELRPGDRINDRAYQSTSSSYAYAKDAGDVVLAVDVPKGYPAAPLPSTNSSEMEIVLRRDTTYQVKKSYHSEDGKLIVHVEVVPDAPMRPYDILPSGEKVRFGAGYRGQHTVVRAPTDQDDLLSALHGTSAKLGEGRSIADIGATSPARAEYVANKAERTAEAAQHFRSKALGERYASSEMAAAERAAQSAPDLDPFFAELRRPKTRNDYVAANIGRAMREEGGNHAAALAKVEREWTERAAADAWAERAAILEYEGGYSRAEAERIAREEMERVPHGPGPEFERPDPKRVEAARKAAASSVERRREIHSAVASNLPRELQTAWEHEGYKFLQQEAPRIRGMKDRISAASKISEAFTEKYGSASETLLGYEGDRFYRRAEIEAKHAESWANEQERKYYARAERELQASHPLAVQKLEQAHEAAVERVAEAATPVERAAAEREVASIEHQLSRVGARPGVVEDIAAAAEVVTKYEKASAKLVEALGDAAPPAAQEAAAAVREAEAAAERKTMDRTTRAIDDHAEQQAAPRERYGWKRDAKVQQHARGASRPMTIEEWRAKYPARAAGPIDDVATATTTAPSGAPATGKLPGQQYIDAAKSGKTQADAAYARARAAEAEAKYGADRAKMTADKLRAEADAARPSMPEPAGKSRLATIATVVGVAGELGIPGIPKPHDIPVVGPLLGALIKYKAIKAAAGRFVGRVPATTDARVAALAARTKDGIARAVDRTLGLAAKPAMRTAVVATSAVLGHRLFDDGEPDAPKGATPQQMAAVRIREIAAAAARPELVVQHVRKQLRGVNDPDLIAAAENHMAERFQYLASVMPKMPPADPLSKTEWLPSAAATSDLAQRLAVVNDPVHAFDNPTPATVDAAQRMNPQLFAMAKKRVMDRMSDIKSPLPYAAKLKAAMLYGSELLAQSMSPPALAVLQATHAQVRAEAAPKPMSPPTPSIAAPADLNQMYDPGNQRRAARM